MQGFGRELLVLHSGHEANYQVEPGAEACRHMPTGQSEPGPGSPEARWEATKGVDGPTFLPSLLQDQCPLSTHIPPGIH